MQKKIYHIVCTGGPCSGKSTFMSRAEEIFAERGYRVLIDHEAATDLITGGISPATMGMDEFQYYCTGLQFKKEALYEKAAENISGDKVIIFYDRGILDDKGYVSQEVFDKLLTAEGTDEQTCKNHYDLVIHLATAAKGTCGEYSSANNAARYEGAEEAIRVDDTILASWQGHPNLVVIESEEDFEAKMQKAVQAIFSFLTGEKPVDVFKKYLIKVDDNLMKKLEEIGAYHTHIHQSYLVSTPGIEKRIRERVRDGNVLHYYSEAVTVAPNKRNKRDKIISEKEYNDYSVEVDPNLGPIDKDRYSFYYDSYFCRLDIFSFDKTQALLVVQLPSDEDQGEIPEFVTVVRDVTDALTYKNYFLAKTQKF